MRKFSMLLLAVLSWSIAVQAHEDDGVTHSNYNYTVYGNYKNMKGVSAATIAATQQKAAAFLPGWSARVDKLSGQFADMYGNAIAVAGVSNMEKVQKLMAGKLADMGVIANEWNVTRDIAAEHASFVDFERVVAGHKVLFSSLSFRFTPDGRLQRVKMKHHGTPEVDLVPTLSANDVLRGAAINQDLTNVIFEKKEVSKDWVWFPIPTEKGYIIHPAWEFHLAGIGVSEMPFEITGYIDALTGELLYRSNAVNETFEVTVKANIHLSTPAAPTTEVLMQDMRIELEGNNYVTNDTGFLSEGSVTNPDSAVFVVRGPWARVYAGGSTPEFVVQNPSSPSTYVLPISDTTTPEFRGVSAFYHVNKIHDYMKTKWNSFTGMDNTPLRTNVDINGNTCNAFYNNGQYSINFYRPQTSCRAFSMVSDIVYHEYGHGISYRFYSANGANFRNGGLGEGNSDVWAMCINGDGVVGDGAYFSGGSVRSYTGAPKVFPQDLVGQVHADGEIIAGSWWDVAVNINSIDTMSDLFALTFYDLPNGPDGTEGDVYHDILISAIMNDDDDANLGNGTPHFSQIVAAFARHGIYLLTGSEFEHTEIANQPKNAAATVTGVLTVSDPLFFDNIYMYYRDRYGISTTWDSVIMNNTTGNTYTAQIPGMPAGTVVDYYFKVIDVATTTAGLPEGYDPSLGRSIVTLPYQYGVGLGVKRYTIDFENDNQTADWDIGLSSDNASDGTWEVGVPLGTISNGQPVQTGSDHTTGSGRCLVTGNGSLTISGDDVDNGLTTTRTPFFDLPFHQPIVEYYRWFSNDRGSSSDAGRDFWKVDIRLPSSALWMTVDYTRKADQRWRRRIFRVSEFVPASGPIQLRFIAEDDNDQNIIEAAIDDFIIYEGFPTGVPDMPEVQRAEVYPNPADKLVNITVPNNSEGSVQLYDVTGKVLKHVPVTTANTQYSINTFDIATGTYMVLIQTQYAVQSVKVVVSHQ